MLPNPEAGLTQEQIDQLEQARKLLPALRAQIRKAETAGLDMTSQKAELDALQTQLDKLYRVYVGRTSTGTTTGRPS